MPPYAGSKFKDEQQYAQCALNALKELEARGVDDVGGLLARSKGLCVLHHDKIAVVAGMDHGHGFCIRQLRPRVWSAPVYLRVDMLSIGLQLTSTSTTTVLFLASQEAVKKLCCDHVKLGGEFALPGGKGGAAAAPSNDSLLAIFHLGEGKLVDVSLGGGMVTTDGQACTQYYGTGVAVSDILAGDNSRAPQPVLFRPLYDYVDGLIVRSGGAPSSS